MRSITLLFVLVFFSINSNANLIKVDLKNINVSIAERLQPFLESVEEKIPPTMKRQLSKEKVIVVRFARLDGENGIVIPNCSNVVDSFLEGKGARSQYQTVSRRQKDVRYNKQIHSYVDKNVIIVNSNFLNVILSGPDKAQKYLCDHKDTYRLAQASVIHGLARIYENSMKRGEKISDDLRYRFVAGWNKEKLMRGFWPRAVNPYEYAGDTADHFAYNMEFFLLDPEYACRRPLLQDYLSRTFTTDPFSGNRNCSVNTELKLPKEYSTPVRDPVTNEIYDQQKTELKTYDLNPNRVYNIYYMRASMGTGIGGFGHSMFRVVVCPPGMSVSKECEKVIDNDLVFNPRANVNEMKLDNMRGFFGGYPSQFLVNSVYDLMEEYGVNELRHLFNMPLGYTNSQGQFIDVMPEDQKERFIWAALEQYWAYYGSYKFISNNCADEAMRLYQMTSADPKVLGLGVLKPNDVNKKLSRLGYIDESEVRQYEKTPGIIAKLFGFGKIRNQKEYDERRAAIENARYEGALVSKVFDIEDAVRGIMKLEGNPNPNFKSAKKEIKRWLDMATPDYQWEGEDVPTDLENISESQKLEILSDTFFHIKARYDRLMKRAKTQEEKNLIVFYFHRIMFHVYNKRAEQVGNKAIQIAYAIAYPNKDRKVKKMPEDINITREQFEAIRNAVDSYSEVQAKLMPFKGSSVKAGYGIPLKSEVVRGEEYIHLKNQEMKNVEDVVESLTGLLGAEHLLLQEIGNFYRELRELRLSSAQALANN